MDHWAERPCLWWELLPSGSNLTSNQWRKLSWSSFTPPPHPPSPSPSLYLLSKERRTSLFSALGLSTWEEIAVGAFGHLTATSSPSLQERGLCFGWPPISRSLPRWTDGPTTEGRYSVFQLNTENRYVSWNGFWFVCDNLGPVCRQRSPPCWILLSPP